MHIAAPRSSIAQFSIIGLQTAGRNEPIDQGISMRKPERLKEGDKVAAITLSWGGPGAFPHRYAVGKKQLEEAFNLQVVETAHALADPDWIYRNPQARADDLMEALIDPSIKAIISTIGGDDSVRILPYLDMDTIIHHPKIFMGYSDTTITHMAFYKAGITSFYGPSFMAGFAENGGMFPYMIDSMRRTLFDDEPIGLISPHTGGWAVERLEWGEVENQDKIRTRNPSTPWRFINGQKPARGHLLGGCVDVLEYLKGTDFFPAIECWKGAILFLETSELAPAPELVQQWLGNYGERGILQELSGIILGRPGGGIPLDDFEKYDQVLIQLLREFGREDLPIITHMDFGHTDPMFLIPYGAEAEIDPVERRFTILENAVSA